MYCSPQDRVVIAIKTDRTLSVTLETVLSPNSRMVMIRPDFMSCIPLISLTNNIPIRIRALGRGKFGVLPGRLRGMVASEAGTVVLYSPGGPAKAVLDKDRLRTVTRVTRGCSLLILSSRVCTRLTCSNRCADFTTVDKVGGEAVLVSKFSGKFTVAN